MSVDVNGDPIDPVDVFLKERDRLPQRCPDWCDRSHEKALEEGCPFEDAAVHRGPAFEANRILGPERRWWFSTELVAEPHRDWWKDAEIRLEVVVDSGVSQMLSLNMGEARTLARRLLHLADLADLEQ